MYYIYIYIYYIYIYYCIARRLCSNKHETISSYNVFVAFIDVNALQ